MKFRFKILFLLFISFKCNANDVSEKFLTLNNIDNFSMKITGYIQTRLEYGDLYSINSNQSNSDSFDAYFRRARIGLNGNVFYPNLTYGLTFAGDDSIQNEIFSAYDSKSTVMLSDIFLNYKLNDNLNIKFGKDKLPFSRIYLVSSSNQLFSERPYYTYLWSDYINGYTYPNISLNGNILNNQINYNFALGQSWRNGDKYGNSDYNIEKADPQATLRIEWSPINSNKNKRSDSNMGIGEHLTLGVYSSFQNNIELVNLNSSTTNKSSSKLYGLDFSYHKNNFFISSEFNYMKKSLSEFSNDAKGFYIQSGYFISNYKIEPAIRYELLKSDGKLDVLTIGINKYIKNQNLKISLDGEFTKYSGNLMLLKPINDNNRKVIRLTGQFMF